MFKKIVFFFCFAVLVLTTGCSKITSENYGQLKIGMDYNEVVSLLGKTDECAGMIGLKSCTWGDENKYIKVSFAGDKVVAFSNHGL